MAEDIAALQIGDDTWGHMDECHFVGAAKIQVNVIVEKFVAGYAVGAFFGEGRWRHVNVLVADATPSKMPEAGD